jgi:phospholipid/cholesterol/gamma-HCH transport system permease protein
VATLAENPQQEPFVAAGRALPHEPRLVHSVHSDGAVRVQALGAWSLHALQPHLEQLRPQLARLAADGSAFWDLRNLQQLDHFGATLLWRAWGRRMAQQLVLRDEHATIFARLERAAEAPLGAHARSGLPLLRLPARWVHDLYGHLHDLVLLLGGLAIELVRMLMHPARAPWREISANLYRTGVQALGITALVGFLIGVVLSFLSSNQLKNFGADVFIVNILGVSIIRELGPVLAAILVAGRSGSSMTAQLGVMRVTQELDAMSVMGIPQTSRLILPKVLALGAGLPLLVLWTDAVALLGGMVAANAELGLSYRYFFDALPAAVPVQNFYLGIGKGVVFGMLIALLACHYGLRIRPNTESLGTGTTSSVVTAITVVILVDAIFAVAFRDIGLGF